MPNLGYRDTPLTSEEIVQMRELRAVCGKSASLKFLSWLFETTVANAHFIVTGATHKDVGGPITEAREPDTEERIVAMRERRAQGIPYAQLAEEFGKTNVAMRSICTGKNFPNFGGPLSKRGK